jgi:hypothetical protein
MPNVKRIEGGTSKPYSDLEPKQTYEKNLSFISGMKVLASNSSGSWSYKTMQKMFPRHAAWAASLNTWDDRNTKNNGTKLNK